MGKCAAITTAENSSFFKYRYPQNTAYGTRKLKGANYKMKHYLNPNKVMKSFVLAGALSVGVLAGGHFTLAAGPDHAKAGHNVHVKVENTVKVNVKETHVSKPVVTVKPVVKEVKVQKPKTEKVNKSQASVHASETAKQHANPNSAVLGKAGKIEKTVTEKIPAQPPVVEVKEAAKPDVTTEAQTTKPVTEAPEVEKDANEVETPKIGDEAIKVETPKIGDEAIKIETPKTEDQMSVKED